MKLTKYSLWATGRVSLVFYLIYLAIKVLIIIVSATSSGEALKVGGMGVDGAVQGYIFMLGLLLFAELFRVGISNSQTRRQVHFSFLLAAALFCVIFSITNAIATFGIFFFAEPQSVFLSIYDSRYTNVQSFSNLLTGMLWDMFFLFLLSTLGFLIGLIYYKLSRRGKIIFSVVAFGLPAVILPTVDRFFTGGKITAWVFDSIRFCLGIAENACNPFIAMISFVIAAAAVSAISYILIRTTPFNDKYTI